MHVRAYGRCPSVKFRASALPQLGNSAIRNAGHVDLAIGTKPACAKLNRKQVMLQRIFTLRPLHPSCSPYPRLIMVMLALLATRVDGHAHPGMNAALETRKLALTHGWPSHGGTPPARTRCSRWAAAEPVCH